MYLVHYLQASCKWLNYLLIQLCIFHIDSLKKEMYLFKSIVKVKQKHVLQNHFC